MYLLYPVFEFFYHYVCWNLLPFSVLTNQLNNIFPAFVNDRGPFFLGKKPVRFFWSDCDRKCVILVVLQTVANLDDVFIA